MAEIVEGVIAVGEVVIAVVVSFSGFSGAGVLDLDGGGLTQGLLFRHSRGPLKEY